MPLKLTIEGSEPVWILAAIVHADALSILLTEAIYIHPTLAEGFRTLMKEVKPMD